MKQLLAVITLCLASAAASAQTELVFVPPHWAGVDFTPSGHLYLHQGSDRCAHLDGATFNFTLYHVQFTDFFGTGGSPYEG